MTAPDAVAANAAARTTAAAVSLSMAPSFLSLERSTDGDRRTDLPREAHAVRRESDEAVPGERGDGFRVGRLLTRGNRAERGRAALAERALEPRLAAQRLVA